jgi:hypothetical protein
MVEDRITDGTRIAELLASELTGLSAGGLGRVDVVDADPSASASPSGTRAYDIALDDNPIGAVSIYPDSATLTVDPGAVAAEPRGEFDCERGIDVDAAGDSITITVEDGAAVKAVADWLAGATAPADPG